MKKLFRNDGFTLVELLITILVGSLVTLAATTILLLGLRFNQVSIGAAKSQNTTRILLTVLENLASEGAVKTVESKEDSWKISRAGKDLLSYDSERQTIYSGNAANGAPLLEGVIASHVSWDETGKLLTVSVETAEGIFSSTIYCRTNVAYVPPSELPSNDLDENSARAKFIEVLMAEYGTEGGGVNPGIIQKGTDAGTYYSKWYIGNYDEHPGWNEKTPWCACFISWAIEQSKDNLDLGDNEVPKYANVDEFLKYFQDKNKWKESNAAAEILPGDLVFFDWIVNSVEDPQHVGVVIAVSQEYIFTIEGNSAGIVAVRKYPINDERILGYGVLDWKM